MRRKPILLGRLAGVLVEGSLSILSGWYTITGGPNAQGQDAETFYRTGVQLASSSSRSRYVSYSTAWPPQTGVLYEAVAGLALTAVVLAALAPAAVYFLQPGAVRSDSSHFSPPLGSPGAGAATDGTWSFYSTDGTGSTPGGPTGPGQSFAGHSGTNDSTLAWGPGEGWFASTAGASFLGASAVLILRPPTAPPKE